MGTRAKESEDGQCETHAGGLQEEKGSKKAKRTSKQAKMGPKATKISGRGMEMTVGDVQYTRTIWVSGKESGPLSGRKGKSEREWEWDVPAAFAF